jgi:hypothetical protein
MNRFYYADTIAAFLKAETSSILGKLSVSSEFAIEQTQRDAWIAQVEVLKAALALHRPRGKIYFEYAIPRLGKRVDVVLLIGHVLFVVEFKVGEREFRASAIDQVWDYALDLKNFHESTYRCAVAPVLVATDAVARATDIAHSSHNDRTLRPIACDSTMLGDVIERALAAFDGPAIDPDWWERGRYQPTPTIIEAATALYNGHSVADISRSDATAINLTRTSDSISSIIRMAKENATKAICFVTGVPGAGKTLVGLNIATQHMNPESDLYSVFLSGNGPLVAILREALARDRIRYDSERGIKLKKGDARRAAASFIQNVHHFRDECLRDTRPPIEHVVLFDEAQRAWNVGQTSRFMRTKKGQPNFSQSEAEFLISCLDRHPDWAVIVCLVGGGQEINTGEAGIQEWIDSLTRSFPHWQAHLSSRLADTEYGSGYAIEQLGVRGGASFQDELHLSVSMRSFRAEQVSSLVKALLDVERESATQLQMNLSDRYPIVLTRSLSDAKAWLRKQARGSERFGVVASSQALRLKPFAVDVKSPMDPVHWFLDSKDDVRSSYYCEDVATEFHVQGLELDWVCVTWDADLRHSPRGWEHWSFCGSRWNRIRKPERQVYLQNAYRVLLTRARQGMVLFVPTGEASDETRRAEYYDSTFEYLQSLGFAEI